MSESKDNKDQNDKNETKDTGVTNSISNNSETKESASSKPQLRYQDLQKPETQKVIERFKEYLNEKGITLQENWPINKTITFQKETKNTAERTTHLLGFAIALKSNAPLYATMRMRGMPDPNKLAAQKHYQMLTVAIQEILEKGADPNAIFTVDQRGNYDVPQQFLTSALIFSLVRGHHHKDIILPLLQAGADVNLPGVIVKVIYHDEYHMTQMPPLFAAIVCESLTESDTIQALMQRGANLKAATLTTQPYAERFTAVKNPRIFQETPLDALQKLENSQHQHVRDKFVLIAPTFYSELYQQILKSYTADNQSRTAAATEVFRNATQQTVSGIERLIGQYIGGLHPDLEDMAQNYLLGQGYSTANDNLKFYLEILDVGQKVYEAELKEKAQEPKTAADRQSTTQFAGKPLTFSGVASSAASATSASSASSISSSASEASRSAQTGLTSSSTTQTTPPQQQQQQQDKKPDGPAKP